MGGEQRRARDDRFDPRWVKLLNDPGYGIIVMRSYPGLEASTDRKTDEDFLCSVGISPE